jgi:RNA polymerase sigma-70 factor (ECF subfamily)
VSDEGISPEEAEELAACFALHAPQLFGYACVVARGNQAHADDLVQAAFEAASRAWRVLRPLSDEQRRGWLRATLATIAVSGSRREGTFRHRLLRSEARHHRIPADPAGRSFPPVVLERCWQVIRSMPEREHTVALLRWQQGMKEDEIASALGLPAETVSAHLDQVRGKLIAQLGPGRDDSGGAPS